MKVFLCSRCVCGSRSDDVIRSRFYSRILGGRHGVTGGFGERRGSFTVANHAAVSSLLTSSFCFTERKENLLKPTETADWKDNGHSLHTGTSAAISLRSIKKKLNIALQG